ncbi:GGDEF domain-containing protein [Desulfosarcina ovata]|uniref:diguanylate cyclase n=1 Tax=Desulfosarcina ovata subsp. ovata TaxID=2752305 RepID=A0A5K8AIV3_9BACT|nr:GGDEF domain-containing protein [Desulfosarcina ovata]BBO92613.1 GGDEF domain-containing protein [Desulfosarcina ovata subsp. ovata]
MHYTDTIDDSRQYLRLALELIGKHGLPTDPLNYCIWYEYASGRNEHLNQSIDEHIKKNGSFSVDVLRQIYNQHVIGQAETVTHLVREELKKVFAEIIGTIKTTRQDFSESENKLESINDALVPDLPEADVEKIVHRIKQEINNLEVSSSSFREQLRQATHEIDQLKLKMARYRKAALKDPLTRVANRRGFEDTLKEAIGKTGGAGSPLCLIIADIDHFKKVNDTHGHLVGDNVLRMVAATIKDSIKGRDLVARIGGEEFAILLPDTPIDGAEKLAENMRLTFEAIDLKKKNSGESLGQVTLSFGVTMYRHGEPTEAFIQRADEALYQSKETGRNQVTRF